MKMESEKRYLICALQASLLENHKVKYENIYDMFFVSAYNFFNMLNMILHEYIMNRLKLVVVQLK